MKNYRVHRRRHVVKGLALMFFEIYDLVVGNPKTAKAQRPDRPRRVASPSRRSRSASMPRRRRRSAGGSSPPRRRTRRRRSRRGSSPASQSWSGDVDVTIHSTSDRWSNASEFHSNGNVEQSIKETFRFRELLITTLDCHGARFRAWKLFAPPAILHFQSQQTEIFLGRSRAQNVSSCRWSRKYFPAKWSSRSCRVNFSEKKKCEVNDGWGAGDVVEVAAGGLRVSFEKLCKSWNFVLIMGDFGLRSAVEKIIFEIAGFLLELMEDSKS